MMEDINLFDEFVKLEGAKVPREKHRVISTLDETHHCKGLVAIAFDCRKDETKVSVEKLRSIFCKKNMYQFWRNLGHCILIIVQLKMVKILQLDKD